MNTKLPALFHCAPHHYHKNRSPYWYIQCVDFDRKKHDKSTGFRAGDPNDTRKGFVRVLRAFSICITASCSSPSPHCRYFAGSARVPSLAGAGESGRRPDKGRRAEISAFANSPRNGSSTNAGGLATMAFTSSCSRDLSPPPRMNLETKSVARRVASPSGSPNRKKSFAFITTEG